MKEYLIIIDNIRLTDIKVLSRCKDIKTAQETLLYHIEQNPYIKRESFKLLEVKQ